MSSRRLGRAAVALFSGGRGAASIARGLLRAPEVDLSVVINGYDNGLSTGALRRYLPGMLGPSDFRKNLQLHLYADDPAQAALIQVLEHRLPAGTTRDDLGDLIGALASPQSPGFGAFGALPPCTRAVFVRELSVLLDRLGSHPGLDLADCALGNLVLAGAYLRLGEDFNAAIRCCVQALESPVRLVNVTNGENAFLVARKRDGRLLANEADIVAPQDAVAITDLFLVREPITPERLVRLETLQVDRLRRTLARDGAEVTLNPEAGDAIRQADLVVYGPGTPHSSLLPSYLTPGVADALAESRAVAKVFVVNIRDDHDVQGLGAHALVGHTLRYLGDPGNERRTITHVLCHGNGVPAAGDTDRHAWAGVRWIVADLEDPECPGVHSGSRTLAALAGVASDAALSRTG
ncbi:hypothetical protein Aph01nite_28900 [Acrocarpospora phusangensis]|uniref:Gluconeogenesis factor n=1 Tax=Acrocarpospora phusangensis TaxID=1070424 RepID=A0A919QDH6_9ACTN|nr:2-phospho-L-lactate transferase CofD family protein [Acrocarpospora phusangensis]GIH24580.1 hypothetical protein Aph01nite_28900 [Acrocarpospora phusangensis]